MTDAREPPGPRGRLLSGSLHDYRRDPLGFLEEARRAHGDVVRVRMAYKTLYLLFHPDAIRDALVTRADDFAKGISYIHIRKVMGDGLLTLEGERWRRQRRLSQPAFLRSNVGLLVPAMREETERTVTRWRDHARRGEAVELFAEMTGSTFNIVGRALLGADTSAELALVREALPVVLEHLYRQVTAVLPVPEWVPTANNRRFRRAMHALDEVVRRLVSGKRAAIEAAARAGEAPRPDLLARFVAARDEATEGMDDRQLRDEVMSNLLAGHETSASGLCWTFWLLTQHPEWAARVRAEVEAVAGDRPLEAEDLARLDLTARVVKEALRLLPPTYAYTRHTLRPTAVQVGDTRYALRGDAVVLLSQWVTHRHPDLWQDPERFDPDRFLPERAAGRPQHAWFPFGGGKHMCIGLDFALTEMTLVTAMLWRAFEVEVVPGQTVEPHPGMTLCPRHGIRVTLRERGATA